MKRMFCVLAIFLLLLMLPNPAMAHEKKTVMLSPFVYLGGHADIHYERSLGNRRSYLITGELIDNYNFNALGLGLGYRKYFGRENFSHAFGEGTMKLIYGVDEENHKHHLGLSTSGLFGYKWIFKKGFTLEAGAGVGIHFSKNPYMIQGRTSTFRLKMGYSW